MCRGGNRNALSFLPKNRKRGKSRFDATVFFFFRNTRRREAKRIRLYTASKNLPLPFVPCLLTAPPPRPFVISLSFQLRVWRYESVRTTRRCVCPASDSIAHPVNEMTSIIHVPLSPPRRILCGLRPKLPSHLACVFPLSFFLSSPLIGRALNTPSCLNSTPRLIFLSFFFFFFVCLYVLCFFLQQHDLDYIYKPCIIITSNNILL